MRAVILPAALGEKSPEDIAAFRGQDAPLEHPVVIEGEERRSRMLPQAPVLGSVAP